MQRLISTASLSGTLAEKLKAASVAHFDGVTLSDRDLVFVDAPARFVREIASDVGLPIMAVQIFSNIKNIPDLGRTENLRRIERKFDMMAELGSPLMVMTSDNFSNQATEDAQLVEEISELAVRAASRGLNIAFQAVPWAKRIKSWRHALQIVKQVNAPNFGLGLDSFFTLLDPAGADGLENIPDNRLFFVQIADALHIAAPVRDWSRNFRCFPGLGDLDLSRFLSGLLIKGYDQPISLEVYYDGLRTNSPLILAENGISSLRLLEEETSIRLEESKTRPSVDLFTPPPFPRCKGVKFIEFACDEASGERLARWLGNLGFKRIGRHRTKKVDLYQMGGVRLILNMQPDSFAYAFFLMHGVSACNIALEVDDPKQAVSRGRFYKANSVFSSGIGPNENLLPALSAPNGSVISFVPTGEDIFDSDFILEEGQSGEPDDALCLGRIDHASLGMQESEFDRWLLFFKSVLGFSIDEALEIRDPYGAVRSRAVRSQGEGVRLSLNIPMGPNTTTAHSVSSYGGAGLQHVAFASSDIIATVKELEARGVKILEIPKNYYKDLEDRYQLDDAFLSEIAEHNILYDQDENGGQFLQVYTQTFEDRFFFEIVQRKNYNQYGAANAATRIAAQQTASGQSPYEYEALEM